MLVSPRTRRAFGLPMLLASCVGPNPAFRGPLPAEGIEGTAGGPSTTGTEDADEGRTSGSGDGTGDPEGSGSDGSSGDSSSDAGVASVPVSCQDAPSGGGSLFVDDLEDGDPWIALPRYGGWYVANDCVTPPVPPVCPGSTDPPTDTSPPGVDDGTGNIAQRLLGGGFDRWGALLAVSLRRGEDGLCRFDASSFGGVSFRMRGTADGTVDLLVRIPGTTPTSIGGDCVAGCDDHHGLLNILLSPTWVTYQVRWEDLAQRGFGTSVPFSSDEVFDLQWLLRSDAVSSFDVWVDDVTFLAP